MTTQMNTYQITEDDKKDILEAAEMMWYMARSSHFNSDTLLSFEEWAGDVIALHAKLLTLVNKISE